MTFTTLKKLTAGVEIRLKVHDTGCPGGMHQLFSIEDDRYMASASSKVSINGVTWINR